MIALEELPNRLNSPANANAGNFEKGSGLPENHAAKTKKSRSKSFPACGKLNSTGRTTSNDCVLPRESDWLFSSKEAPASEISGRAMKILSVLKATIIASPSRPTMSRYRKDVSDDTAIGRI